MKSRAPLLALVAVVAASAVHAWWLSPMIPARVASHFDFTGHPNGWVTKSGFLTNHLVVVAVIFVMTSLADFGISRLPVRFVNLPNRSYWLDPSRRAETARWIRGWSQLMGALTIGLLTFIWDGIVRANQRTVVELGPTFHYAVAGFLLVTVGMIAWLLVRFARIPR